MHLQHHLRCSALSAVRVERINLATSFGSSFFDRYNIVSDEDLKEATKGHQAYLDREPPCFLFFRALGIFPLIRFPFQKVVLRYEHNKSVWWYQTTRDLSRELFLYRPGGLGKEISDSVKGRRIIRETNVTDKGILVFATDRKERWQTASL